MDNLIKHHGSDYILDNFEHMIRVEVESKYYGEDHSNKTGVFIWMYNIKIKNFGSSTIQIMERYWQIFDANGHVEEVKVLGL